MKIEKKLSLYVFIIAVLTLLPLRIFQYIKNVDHLSGFNNKANFLNFTPVVLAFFIVVIIAISIFGQAEDKGTIDCILLNPFKFKYDKISARTSTAAAVSAILMCCAVVFDMVISIIKMKKADYPKLELTMIFIMFISIFVFLSIGTSVIKGNGISKTSAGWFIMPMLWRTLYCIKISIENIALSSLSEKTYIMLSSMTMVIFFVQFIRFFVGFGKMQTKNFLLASALISSLFAILSVVPRFVFIFYSSTKEFDFMVKPTGFEVISIFFSLTILKAFFGKYVYKYKEKLTY